MNVLDIVIKVIVIGAGATAVMDAWLLVLRRLGVKTLDFAMVGRWVGHLAQGRFSHAAIARATPIAGERLLGWAAHYAIGVAFAALLAALAGARWLDSPSLAPALALGVATVAAPLLVMQPAMGAGFAASNTPTPLRNCLRSLANHAVFGLGLYLAALCVSWLTH